MAMRTGRPLWNRFTPVGPMVQPDPPPEVIAKRPHQAPSVGASFATDENLDAQRAWMAHIEAGRIKVIR
jgi:hypothetical protein